MKAIHVVVAAVIVIGVVSVYINKPARVQVAEAEAVPVKLTPTQVCNQFADDQQNKDESAGFSSAHNAATRDQALGLCLRVAEGANR